VSFREDGYAAVDWAADYLERVGELPVLAPIPGGNANVFTRALGLPADPVDATGHILAAISRKSTRTIGLGLAGDPRLEPRHADRRVAHVLLEVVEVADLPRLRHRREELDLG